MKKKHKKRKRKREKTARGMQNNNNMPYPPMQQPNLVFDMIKMHYDMEFKKLEAKKGAKIK